MSKLDSISFEQFSQANNSGNSISEALSILGLKPYTKHYTWYRERCQQWGLTPPSFQRPPGYNQRKYSNEEMFVQESSIKFTGNQLKRRLLNDFGWEDKCSMPDCPNPEPVWRGQKLTIQLDHINGDNLDNRLDNLRFLCPNCHTQTDTFSGRKLSSYVPKDRVKVPCPSCDSLMSISSKHCKSCSAKATHTGRTKIVWPSKDDLLHMIKETNVFQTGKSLGVSDNAVRKHLLNKHGVKI